LPLEIFIPENILEQKKVVEKYFIYEKDIISINNEIKNQERYVKHLRQAILKEAMEGKLIKQDPKDGNAQDLLEQIKKEKEKLVKEKKIPKSNPLPPITPEEIPYEIPDNWVWCRLGEITGYGSSKKAEPADIDNNTWILDLEDIEKETSKLLNKVRFKERKSSSTKSVFNKGDVLYSKLRPYLDKVIVADENGVCTTEILPFKCFANFNPEYFRFILKNPEFVRYVNGVTKGMKMPRLGTNEGQNALVPLSPLPEQIRIVDKLNTLMNYCDELEKSIADNKAYLEMLLQVSLKDALKS